MDNSLILAVAPNGARKLKSDLPQIPLTAIELAETARECLETGASMIHLHVRNENGQHSLSPDIYRKAIDEIKRATDNTIFIQVTSEAVDIYTPQQQFAMIHELKPQAVSIGLREIKSLDNKAIKKHFEMMRKAHTHPQLILYNQTDLDLYHRWLETGILLGNKFPILLVIGKETPDGCFHREDLSPNLVKNLRASSWMVCGFDENEFSTCVKASKLGGNLRIGFENNHMLENNETAINNAQLVQQMAHHLKSKNMTLAKVSETIERMRPDW